MGTCSLCHAASPLISKEMGVCLRCIRQRFSEAQTHLNEVHARSREAFHLPPWPPREAQGAVCRLCQNQCRMAPGQYGYCGTRRNQEGRIVGGRPHEGNLSFYHDPLPTNCVGDWVCPGGTGAGYPRWAYRSGPEYGYDNLAVFYHSCTFNCLYCQNWHFKTRTYGPEDVSAKRLAQAAGPTTACICYFGGDPTPHLLHALKASRLALKERSGRILRICWETNGAMEQGLLGQMAQLSLESGGCVKFDLKAWNEETHRALCGVSNRRTLNNFKFLSELIQQRPEPPLVIASTLLVPGYIDQEEVRGIASFIASLDPHIPYALLAFHPQFYLKDLPLTSKDQAYQCLEAAREQGLTRVRLGNVHLLT